MDDLTDVALGLVVAVLWIVIWTIRTAVVVNDAVRDVL